MSSFRDQDEQTRACFRWLVEQGLAEICGHPTCRVGNFPEEAIRLTEYGMKLAFPQKSIKPDRDCSDPLPLPAQAIRLSDLVTLHGQ